MKKRFPEEQIIRILKEQGSGERTADVYLHVTEKVACRKAYSRFSHRLTLR